MKTETTSIRLNRLMKARNIRQVDILARAKPFCEKYSVKLGKNDLSQYVSGKVEPGRDKLTILGLALDVSEAWLLGYDVPQARTAPTATSDGPAKLAAALSSLGIHVDRLSEANISKIAALAKLALDE